MKRYAFPCTGVVPVVPYDVLTLNEVMNSNVAEKRASCKVYEICFNNQLFFVQKWWVPTLQGSTSTSTAKMKKQFFFGSFPVFLSGEK